MTPSLCFAAPHPLPLSRPRASARSTAPRRPRVPPPRRTAQVSAAAAGAPARKVLVVGAGIIGLTTALRLHDAGHVVELVAQSTPSSVFAGAPGSCTPAGDRAAPYTSAGSGGFWMPVFLDGEDEVQRWGTAAYNAFCDERPDVGVHFYDGFKVYASAVPQLEWYADMTDMQVVTHADDARVPPQYKAALRFRAPIVDMAAYLPELERRVREREIPISLTADLQPSTGSVTDTAGAAPAWDLETARLYAETCFGPDAVLVNCAGLGAAPLSPTPGEQVRAGRGVVARVVRPESLDYFITEAPEDGLISRDGLLAYALPCGAHATLGGTLFMDDYEAVPTRDEVDGVLRRSAELAGLDAVQFRYAWSGFRPIMSDARARVEWQGGPDDAVIANYGHGGSGVTLSWGCADEVVSLVGQMS